MEKGLAVTKTVSVTAAFAVQSRLQRISVTGVLSECVCVCVRVRCPLSYVRVFMLAFHRFAF